MNNSIASFATPAISYELQRTLLFSGCKDCRAVALRSRFLYDDNPAEADKPWQSSAAIGPSRRETAHLPQLSRNSGRSRDDNLKCTVGDGHLRSTLPIEEQFLSSAPRHDQPHEEICVIRVICGYFYSGTQR